MTDTGYIPDPALAELVAEAVAREWGYDSLAEAGSVDDGEFTRVCDTAHAVLSALAAEGRLLPAPLLAVHTNDGRVYHPYDVQFEAGPWLPAPTDTEETP